MVKLAIAGHRWAPLAACGRLHRAYGGEPFARARWRAPARHNPPTAPPGRFLGTLSQVGGTRGELALAAAELGRTCNIVGVGASIDRLWPEYLTVFPTASKYDALHRPPSLRGAGLSLESKSNPDALPPGARLARRLHRPAITARKRLSSPSGFAEPWVAALFRASHPGLPPPLDPTLLTRPLNFHSLPPPRSH